MAESKLVIEGGHPLQGEIRIQGAKNSVLPLLSAVVLCDEDVVLERCPALSDVYAASRILTHLGCRCSFRDGKMEIRNGGISRSEIPEAMMHEMRSSITFLGPLLSRTGSCTLYLPGGCELGPRPIDMHLHALRQMGRRSMKPMACSGSRADSGALICICRFLRWAQRRILCWRQCLHRGGPGYIMLPGSLRSGILRNFLRHAVQRFPVPARTRSSSMGWSGSTVVCTG